MKPDLHLHTAWCGHASGSAEEMVRSAAQKGFSLAGFSEHFPYPSDYNAPISGAVALHADWPKYLKELERLKQKYAGQIEILTGAEIDYLPDRMEMTRGALQEYAYDYIYGSVHLIEDIGIDYKEAYLAEHIEELGGPDRLWEKYWKALDEFAGLEICDIFAHLDLPRKLQAARPERDQTDGVRHILERMKAHDLVLEINTGGVDRSCSGEAYPAIDILRHASELGLGITFGSDAHAPEQVGRYYAEAAALVQSLGWRNWIVFRNREKEYVSVA